MSRTWADLRSAARAIRRRRRTAEQGAAFEQLRKVVASLRLRVVTDAEGFPIIAGRHGQIEWHETGGRWLAVFSTHKRMFRRLWEIPGVRRHQTGDDEMRALFPPHALRAVAALIKARRRRVGRSSHRKRCGDSQRHVSEIGDRPHRRTLLMSLDSVENVEWMVFTV